MTDKHIEILKNYSDDRDSQKDVRDERIPDLTFARWSQTDDIMSEACTTEFIGEFNIVGRERKAIQAEFRQNEVEVNFRSKSEDNDDLDELVQGKYRTDGRLSNSQQCFKIAQDDTIDCGFGAWRLHTVDEDSENEIGTALGIARSPIPEAIRCVFFDCNAKLYDKSDAMRCSLITSYTEDAYKRFLADNDLDETNVSFTSFDCPYHSIYESAYGYAMPYPLFHSGHKEINLLEYYEIVEETEIYYQYLMFDGTQETIIAKPKAEAEAMGLGEPFRKKKVKKHKCMKYVSNGVDILIEQEVAGGMIPIIPMYGERNYVDGVENFYGLVKAAKDPQKLINACYNYLASLMMYSPVPKPIYDPREIEGYEEHDDANNHEYAYLRKNKTYVDENNQTIPFAQEYTMPPQVPPAIAAMMTQLPQMTDAILNPGVTEDSFASDMSGVALQELKEQVGVMRYIFLDNYGHSMQRDAEVYAAMLADVIDTPRSLVITNPDGTTQVKRVNVESFDAQMMSTVISNQIKGAQFNVYSKIAPSYKSQRDASLGNMKELFQSLPPGDPMQRIVMLDILAKQDGEGLDEINKVARFELLGLGLPGIEPQTEEEMMYVQMLQQQKANQTDPAQEALAAESQARLMEGQAAIQNEINDANKNLIEKQKADNDTARVMLDAKKIGMDIQLKEQDLINKRVDNLYKIEEKEQDIEGKIIDNTRRMLGS